MEREQELERGKVERPVERRREGKTRFCNEEEERSREEERFASSK